MVNSLVRLQTLVIRGCELMEGVVDTRLGREELMTTIVFPELLCLELVNLPKLTRFATGNSIEFSSLTILRISSCPDLERFISSSTCADKLSLEENIHTADMQPFFDSKVDFLCCRLFFFILTFISFPQSFVLYLYCDISYLYLLTIVGSYIC